MKNRKGRETKSARMKTPRRNYSRWRAASLILVYVGMAAHVTHWMIAGRTLAPLELNEVMFTLELGIVTAGFLFMAAVTLATLVVGRFFCSWGCHILALQDFCHWILGKLHIHPRPIRSRAMLWIPVVAALYMFVWPQVTRIAEGRPLPELHFRTDAQGWASLATENFWRNLPGPGMALLTFGVCGFLTVYALGSRGFCAYGCPYGALFRLADRFAPGRIRTTAVDCSDCGACTAACGSNIRVHEELSRFGMVASSACLKDLDCVAACPSGSVHFGFGRPSLLKKIRVDTPIRKRYDFTLWEEALMIVVFLLVLVTFRGLYDLVPFLLCIGLGAVVAFLVVVSIRLVRRSDMQWNRLTLKSSDRLTQSGYAFLMLMVAFGGFSAHSGFVHYHSFQGRRLANAVPGHLSDEAEARPAIAHLSTANRWGLLRTDRDLSLLAELNYQVAGMHFHARRPEKAQQFLLAALLARPGFVMAHYDLGALLIEQGEVAEGIYHLRSAVNGRPDFADGHYNLGLAHWMMGAEDEARRELDTAFRLNPEDKEVRTLHGLMHGIARP